jgi:hypothetical protein
MSGYLPIQARTSPLTRMDGAVLDPLSASGLLSYQGRPHFIPRRVSYAAGTPGLVVPVLMRASTLGTVIGRATRKPWP